MKTSAAAVLLLWVAAAWTVPSLTITYHRSDHAAPLFGTCRYPSDFLTPHVVPRWYQAGTCETAS